MAIVYSGTRRAFMRSGGAWVVFNTSKVPYFQLGGWSKVYQLWYMRAGTWTLSFTTDAHKPALAPVSPFLTITGTAFARHCQATWTQAAPAGTYNAYNTFWRFTNNTDATKNTTGNISPNGGVVTFTVATAGVSGDSVTVDVWYNDGTFDGPTSTVNGTL